MKMPGIDRRLRCMFAGQIVGDVQENYLRGQVLHRRSGDLAASIAYRDTAANETMIGSYGIVYARIHELGGDIYPKRGPYLIWREKTFRSASRVKGGWRVKQNYGGWIFAKHVHIPKRPYLLPGIQNYFQSGEAPRDAEVFLQKELDRVEKS
jgi:phage gpG-like protein